MINAEIGEENTVFMKLGDTPESKEAYLVYGLHDIIARIETTTMQELKDIIYKIRYLEKENQCSL